MTMARSTSSLRSSMFPSSGSGPISRIMSARRRFWHSRQTECQSSLMSQPADPIETGRRPSHSARGRRWRRASTAPSPSRSRSTSAWWSDPSARCWWTPVPARPRARPCGPRWRRSPIGRWPRSRSTHWHYDHAFGLAGVRRSADHRPRVRTRRGWARPRPRAEAARLGVDRRRPGRAGPGARGGDRASTSAAAGWRSPTSAAGTPTATWWSSCRTRTWSSPAI